MRLIKNYRINNILTFTVELAYDNNGSSVIRGVRQVPRAHYKHHVTLKGLLKFKNGQLPVYAFIETRAGVLPLSLCIEKKIGGYLLF